MYLRWWKYNRYSCTFKLKILERNFKNQEQSENFLSSDCSIFIKIYKMGFGGCYIGKYRNFRKFLMITSAVSALRPIPLHSLTTWNLWSKLNVFVMVEVQQIFLHIQIEDFGKELQESGNFPSPAQSLLRFIKWIPEDDT